MSDRRYTDNVVPFPAPRPRNPTAAICRVEHFLQAGGSVFSIHLTEGAARMDIAWRVISGDYLGHTLKRFEMDATAPGGERVVSRAFFNANGQEIRGDV